MPPIPGMTMGNPLKAPNVSTAGVHPLVRKSMLPRIKLAKQTSPMARSKMMAAGPARNRQNMSVGELRSTRSEIGRKPRA